MKNLKNCKVYKENKIDITLFYNNDKFIESAKILYKTQYYIFFDIYKFIAY